MFKPWLSKSVKDTRRSTERDYPPKRKKPWLAGSFPEMEHFHEETYRPFDYPVVPPRVDRCAGRVLRPDAAVTWGSGEGGIPKDGDVKEFQTSVSGAVGDVTYYMDPFWSEVNEDGDVASIDESGKITLEEGVCQGSYPPWIIYWVCDDCGCSTGTIWLEDSSEDCCGGCDCESDPADDCVANCCMTEDGTEYEITTNSTKQYTCSGGGEWSVTGIGATIDATGLLTTDGSACGTITVHNSACQDKEVRVINVGYWDSPVTICGTLGASYECDVYAGKRFIWHGGCYLPESQPEEQCGACNFPNCPPTTTFRSTWAGYREWKCAP